MDKNTIKTLLLLIFKNEFNIDNHVDIYSVERQEFMYSAGFEFQSANDADKTKVYMDIEGEIIKDLEPIKYHNPIGDGRLGEAQEGGIFIQDWSITEVTVYVDGEIIEGLITVTDLAEADKITLG